MSKRQRRRYSPEEKAKILRLHLLEQVPISEICEKQGIHPTMFYQWQKALFENAAAALEGHAALGVRTGKDRPWRRWKASSSARMKCWPCSRGDGTPKKKATETP